MADTTNAASDILYRLPCEFCGTTLKIRESELLDNRVVCEDCRARVKWCPECKGTGCEPRTVSCGCCTDGCICVMHQDCPRGLPPYVCEFHQGHAHPKASSPFDAHPPCAVCFGEGVDPKAGCQKSGTVYCEVLEQDCEGCRLRIAERRIEQAEDRMDHAREMGWAR